MQYGKRISQSVHYIGKWPKNENRELNIIDVAVLLTQSKMWLIEKESESD